MYDSHQLTHAYLAYMQEDIRLVVEAELKKPRDICRLSHWQDKRAWSIRYHTLDAQKSVLADVRQYILTGSSYAREFAPLTENHLLNCEDDWGLKFYIDKLINQYKKKQYHKQKQKKGAAKNANSAGIDNGDEVVPGARTAS